MAEIQTILRRTVLRLLGKFAPAGDAPLPDLASFERVLLTFVNWRLGNNILVTPAVAALTEAFPGVRFEVLGGPAAVPVLEGYPIERVTVITRAQVLDPVRRYLLIRRLRKEAYPAALHLHPATATLGAYFAGKSGAPARIGCLRPEGNLYFTATVPRPTKIHKVDRMNEYLGHLGLPTGQRRRLRLSEDEQAEGEAQVARVCAAPPEHRVAMFLSGRKRKGKAFGSAYFAAVADGLRARGLAPVVILGPEEVRRGARIRTALGEAAYIERLPVRTVAAILGRCRAVVAPDSGPMHLAIASRTPTVALFRTPDGAAWGPREDQGAVVFDPGGEDAAAALTALDGVLAAPRG